MFECVVINLLPVSSLLEQAAFDRFAEWGMAAWEKQRESLAEPTKRIDVRFLSVYHSDSKDKAAHEEAIRGKIMKEWWDSCELAGPKSRATATFPESLPDLTCLSVTNGEVKTLWIVFSKTVLQKRHCFQ